MFRGSASNSWEVFLSKFRSLIERRLFSPEPIDPSAVGIDLALVVLPVGDVLLPEIREDNASAGSIGEIDRPEGEVIATKRETGVGGFESAAGGASSRGDEIVMQGIDAEKLPLEPGGKGGSIDADPQVGKARNGVGARHH